MPLRKRKEIQILLRQIVNGMLAAAVFCLAYYLIICLAMGKWNSTFARFWLGAGTGCLFLHLAVSYGPPRLALAVYGSFSIALFIFAAVEIRILSGMKDEKEAECPFIIVLGAQIQGMSVTNSLRRRLDRAVSYLEAHPDTKVIVSGGRGKGESVTEAEAMRDYLENRGIGQNRIILEDRSTSTKENLIFSKKFISDLKKPVGIVTNNFHMFRAKACAGKLGYENPCGLSAGSNPVLFLNYMTREFFAVWKMWIFG